MSAAYGNSEIDDSDLIAIRNLLMENTEPLRAARQAPETAPKPARPLSASPVSRQASAPEAIVRAPVPQPAAGHADAENGTQSQKVSAGRSAAVKAAALRKIRAYRPRTKVVIGTSLVLLFVLHPISMIGWTIFTMIFVLALYLIIGEERFCRGLLAVQARYRRINPSAARVFGLRLRLAARKWNRWVTFLPQGMADALQTPDISAVMRAEARHEAALTDRFSRLDAD